MDVDPFGLPHCHLSALITWSASAEAANHFCWQLFFLSCLESDLTLTWHSCPMLQDQVRAGGYVWCRLGGIIQVSSYLDYKQDRHCLYVDYVITPMTIIIIDNILMDAYDIPGNILYLLKWFIRGLSDLTLHFITILLSKFSYRNFGKESIASF